MIIISKCKMYLGSLSVTEGTTICECEYRRTMQTVFAFDKKDESI